MPFDNDDITLTTRLGADNYWDAQVHFDSKKYTTPVESYDSVNFIHKISVDTRSLDNGSLRDPETVNLRGAKDGTGRSGSVTRRVQLWVDGALKEDEDRDQVETEDGAGGDKKTSGESEA